MGKGLCPFNFNIVSMGNNLIAHSFLHFRSILINMVLICSLWKVLINFVYKSILYRVLGAVIAL